MDKAVFIAPTTDIAKRAVDSLHEMHLSNEHIGAVAKDDTKLEQLPETDYEDENDVVPAIQRGATVGAGIGLLAGLTGVAVAPLGLVAAGAAVAVTTVGGATFGTFASAMVGVSVPNSRLREYEDALERGEILLIVDLEEDRAADIRNELTERHPELRDAGELSESTPAV